MARPKILVAFYSTYGNNMGVARIAAEAAEAAGGEVRLRRFAETAPMEVVESQDAWKANFDAMQQIEQVSHDDMEWADGYFLSAPTRYGNPPSQVTSFTDTLGGLWSQGKLANKCFTVTTSAQNDHGGQEGTLHAFYQMATHWGCILVPPGYADPVKFEDGGNPYGYSKTAGEDANEASIAFQARRLTEMTAKLVS